LQKLYPSEPKIFIFNGEILSPKMAFTFYRIEEGSSIVVLPDQGELRSPGISTWLTITRDSDNFNERINFSRNPQTRQEVSRLRDLRFLELERRPRMFVKFAQCIDQHNEGDAVTRPAPKLKIDFEPLEKPSCEPLPVVWKVIPEAMPVTIAPSCIGDQARKVADVGLPLS
jgi:hypothetical protein